ncbi:MAG: hypothetical protein LBR07_06775 [Puniceicoccales bacterium]|jgi:hypothetical protein|nr:hypothetical protein [Puniceicoccales bacterium]
MKTTHINSVLPLHANASLRLASPSASPSASPFTSSSSVAHTVFSALSALFVLFALFAFCSPAVPFAAPVAHAASSTVTISNSDTDTSHQIAIQNALNSAGSGNTVTVKGTRELLSGRITLSIPAGVKLAWQANLSGEGGLAEVLNLMINNNGAFEMTSGSIRNTGDAPSGRAIYFAPGSKGTCTISGGTVSANDTDGTITNAGTTIITINGTAVVSGMDRAISSTGRVIIDGNASVTTSQSTVIYSSYSSSGDADPAVTISGGTVGQTAGIAVLAGSGNIIVSGGKVNGPIQTSGNITVSGGTVNASNNAIYAVGSASKVTVSGGVRCDNGRRRCYTDAQFLKHRRKRCRFRHWQGALRIIGVGNLLFRRCPN